MLWEVKTCSLSVSSWSSYIALNHSVWPGLAQQAVHNHLGSAEPDLIVQCSFSRALSISRLFTVTVYVSVYILSVYIKHGGFGSFSHNHFSQVWQLLCQCYGGWETSEPGSLGYSRTRRLWQTPPTFLPTDGKTKRLDNAVLYFTYFYSLWLVVFASKYVLMLAVPLRNPLGKFGYLEWIRKLKRGKNTTPLAGMNAQDFVFTVLDRKWLLCVLFSSSFFLPGCISHLLFACQSCLIWKRPCQGEFMQCLRVNERRRLWKSLHGSVLGAWGGSGVLFISL